MFCLDCKQKNHPFKRCWKNRLDLENVLEEEEKEGLEARNKRAEEILNNLYFKKCCKQCPNLKCGLRIQKIEGYCEGQPGNKMQCPKCHQHFCWACLQPAKGQKHYKERLECLPEDPFRQVEELSKELKDEVMDVLRDDFLNLRFCARCPSCDQICQKTGTNNLIGCSACENKFCFICNFAVEGEAHFNEEKSLCHLNSDPWTDI